ncbi:hypothetical protein A3Q56_00769 [Intoshia linei]|uniref:Uncharacterized protein n=1 Tax=Intoshia linei TaxID=1819745 RepID=A0A177BB70_9BILA|nr:hypothetical protein A3Q56_00769 [Intoshia linei]
MHYLFKKIFHRYKHEIVCTNCLQKMYFSGNFECDGEALPQDIHQPLEFSFANLNISNNSNTNMNINCVNNIDVDHENENINIDGWIMVDFDNAERNLLSNPVVRKKMVRKRFGRYRKIYRPSIVHHHDTRCVPCRVFSMNKNTY